MDLWTGVLILSVTATCLAGGIILGRYIIDRIHKNKTQQEIDRKEK